LIASFDLALPDYDEPGMARVDEVAGLSRNGKNLT